MSAVPRYAVEPELKKELEKVVAEMAKASDEQLAAEVEAYRESLTGYEFEGPGLGKIALQATSPGRGPRSGRYLALDDNDRNGGG